MLLYLPESPRYLLRQDKLEATVNILRKIYPYASEAQLHLKADVISKSVKDTMGHTATLVQTWKRLHLNAPNFRALVVACGLQGIQQLCGFNTLMYYAPTLFENVGFDNSLVIGLVISIVNLAFTLVALVIIDKAGRRRIACLTVPGMCGALVLAAIAFHFLTINTGGQLPDDGVGLSKKWNPVVLFSMLLYVAFYATGIGNIPWQQGELFEMSVRGMGTALATTCNWGASPSSLSLPRQRRRRRASLTLALGQAATSSSARRSCRSSTPSRPPARSASTPACASSARSSSSSCTPRRRACRSRRRARSSRTGTASRRPTACAPRRRRPSPRSAPRPTASTPRRLSLFSYTLSPTPL